MRMRKKKNLDTRLANCAPVLVSDPEQHKGQWRALFGNTNPLHLEIGCARAVSSSRPPAGIRTSIISPLSARKAP